MSKKSKKNEIEINKSDTLKSIIKNKENYILNVDHSTYGRFMMKLVELNSDLSISKMENWTIVFSPSYKNFNIIGFYSEKGKEEIKKWKKNHNFIRTLGQNKEIKNCCEFDYMD